jgi:hypothetical protein
MTTCTLCGGYFKQSEYNDSDECYDCVDVVPPLYDSVFEADVQELVNPTGKTQAKFLE